MFAKLLDWFGGPAVVDLLHKLGAGKLTKNMIESFKAHGREMYERYDRQAKLSIIKPLIITHVIAVILNALLVLVALKLAVQSSADAWSYFWMALMLVPVAGHVWMIYRLPTIPVFKRDEDGDFVVFPDTVEIDGETEAHPYAGQRELDDDCRIDRSRVSLGLTVNMTVGLGFVSGVLLLILTATVGNRAFLFLSMFTMVTSVAMAVGAIRIVNWFLVRFVGVVEGSVGYLFRQALILLPEITSENAPTTDSAKRLFPEEKFLPMCFKVVDSIVGVYLTFAFALVVHASVKSFSLTAIALLALGIPSYMLIKRGEKEFVKARELRTWKFIFAIFAPAFIVYLLFQMFFPEALEDFHAMFVNAFGYLRSPSKFCGFVDHKMPFTNALVASILGSLLYGLYRVWNAVIAGYAKQRKDRKDDALFAKTEKWTHIVTVSIACALVVAFGFRVTSVIVGLKPGTEFCQEGFDTKLKLEGIVKQVQGMTPDQIKRLEGITSSIVTNAGEKKARRVGVRQLRELLGAMMDDDRKTERESVMNVTKALLEGLSLEEKSAFFVAMQNVIDEAKKPSSVIDESAIAKVEPEKKAEQPSAQAEVVPQTEEQRQAKALQDALAQSAPPPVTAPRKPAPASETAPTPNVEMVETKRPVSPSGCPGCRTEAFADMVAAMGE